METSKHKRNTKHLLTEPYKYTDEVPQMILDFFDRELFQEINGKTYPTPLPTVEGFCKTIYISKATFHNWLKKEPEMKKAYAIAKNFQYEQLIYLTQIGFYKEGISKMLAANLTDLKSETQLAKEAETQGDENKKELTLNYSVNQIPEQT